MSVLILFLIALIFFIIVLPILVFRFKIYSLIPVVAGALGRFALEVILFALTFKAYEAENAAMILRTQKRILVATVVLVAGVIWFAVDMILRLRRRRMSRTEEDDFVATGYELELDDTQWG